MNAYDAMIAVLLELVEAIVHNKSIAEKSSVVTIGNASGEEAERMGCNIEPS